MAKDEVNRLEFNPRELYLANIRHLPEERICAAVTGIPAEILKQGYESSMAKTNVAVKQQPIFTHEGAKASHINPEQQLRRLVMAHMLWEDQFYIDGKTVAEQVAEAIKHVKAEKVAEIAIEARERQKLRHIPLFICRVMAGLPTHKHVVADTLARVIQRADELAEYVSLYWKDGRVPLSAQSKKGLARAFQKFDEYQLAKYNRDGVVKLKDVAALCHFKPAFGMKGYTRTWRKQTLTATGKEQWPADELTEQSAMLDRLMKDELKTPDTWEVKLSGGANKKETFEQMLAEKKLGAMAFLRNLRNMHQAGMDVPTVFSPALEMNFSRVLPFRFISAAKHVPIWEPHIERLMLKACETMPKLKGKTAIVVDNSGSMYGTAVSAKSEIDRADAACALAILAREVCEEVVVIGYGTNAMLIPARRGFALRDAIKAGPGGGTNTQLAILAAAIASQGNYSHNPTVDPNKLGYDRIIVITDEQSHQAVQNPLPNTLGYIINVGAYKNGIGYGQFTHIDGWSEAVLDFIRVSEETNQ